jgi:excisionase family DNA binding protein
MVWLTVQEAAELLRVPVSWLYERTRTNSIPHVKLGKYLRFDQDELTTWIDEMRGGWARTRSDQSVQAADRAGRAALTSVASAFSM